MFVVYVDVQDVICAFLFLSGTPSSVISMPFRSGGLFHGCSSPEPSSKKAIAPKIYVPDNIPKIICH